MLLLAAAPLAADPLPGAEPLPAALSKRIERARKANKTPRTRHTQADGRARYANRLALEASPYLQQHAHNPVNWFPWGDEAFAEAERLKRPVLLSIGYSTCHWCHVMEEESFEDPEIAEFMNRHYVAIKVDREERPDVDGVYMAAVQALTGGGGWPMTVWITPDRRPFYGGTYFPPRAGAGGRPGFLPLLQRLAAIYDREGAEVAASAGELTAVVTRILEPEPAVGIPGAEEIERALDAYKRAFDPTNGGLRGRQKFPASLPLPLLLRAHRRSGDPELERMVRITLDAMSRGGIYDHVAGGFHRYTVEPTWTVPHFEKMLYDNALLVLAYVEGWQATGDPAYGRVARDVLDYVAREMTAPEGSFYSATDADSEGEEGLFFIWDHQSLRDAAGPELADLAIQAYGLDSPANFEGTHWVLRRDRSAQQLASARKEPVAEIEAALEQIRARLREARSKRVPPLRDDKQLVSWNGLMIEAFARAGLAFRDAKLVGHATAAARAVLSRGYADGVLTRYLLNGKPHGRGLLNDYAFFISGQIALFEATGNPRWLQAAIALQAAQDRGFFDNQVGGYWISPEDGDALLVREKPVRDGALPSGNARSALNLLRLYHLTGSPLYRERAEMTLRVFSDVLRREPSAYGRMLEAVDFLVDTPLEILIVTPHDDPQPEPFLQVLGRAFLPNRIVAVVPEARVAELSATLPLLEEKRALGGSVTAYVCENRVCQQPARDPELFAVQLARDARPYPDANAPTAP